MVVKRVESAENSDKRTDGTEPSFLSRYPADVEAMRLIPGGTFLMGSNNFYPEERPVHRVTVREFLMDVSPVTNSQFSRFVEDTGYTTVAERPPDPDDYPGVDPDQLVPGSLVFRQPKRRRGAGTRSLHQWWHYVPGASWRAPEGPGSNLIDRMDHPVVHIAWEDAVTYARWANKELPTEAEWEYAARGGIDGAVYVWGDEPPTEEEPKANIWQGEFPWVNLGSDGYGADGYERTSPVGVFPANGYGLYDMAGNVWEWTSDVFGRHRPGSSRPCCSPRRPVGLSQDGGRQNEISTREETASAGGGGGVFEVEDGSAEKKQAAIPEVVDRVTGVPQRVLKGGSHLCASNYCLRYRPAARQAESIDTSASHIGFRCIVREA